MKRILTIFFAAALFAACSDNLNVEMGLEGGCYLTISTDAMATKADATGEDKYNENLVSDIHFFLYAKGSTACVADGSVDVLSSSSKTVRLPLTDAQFDVLFADDATEADVLVLANCDETAISALDSKTPEAVKALTVSFADANSTQDNFVMWSETTLTKVDKASLPCATGSASLKRVASKITMSLTIPQSITEESKEWTPVRDGLKIKFIGGANNGNILGEASAASVFFDNDGDDDDYLRSSGFTFTYDSSTTDPYVVTMAPFYTYPVTWTPGAAAEPYFYITLPWQQVSDATLVRTCYYKVILSNTSFTSNDWYDISLKISAFPADGEPVEVRPLECNIADWKDSITTGDSGSTGDDDEYNTVVDISATRFLTVDETEYVLNNQESIDISFNSSHTIKIVSISYDSGNTAQNTECTCMPINLVGTTSIVKHVVFSHEIVNYDGTASNFDYKEYKVTFRVQHSSTDSDMDAQYYKEITIIQRPALCISTELNSASESSDSGTGYLTVFVDGDQRPQKKPSGSGYGYRCLGGSVDGHYLVDVSVSALPEDSEFIIADPRSRTNVMDGPDFPWNGVKFSVNICNNYPMTGFAETAYSFQNKAARHIRDMENTSTEKLRYYYPTDSVGHANVIAPSFRISTGYGGSGYSMKMNEAKVRCSSYQEAGYPAGRWRIPTEAECHYIQLLQTKGYIANPIFKTGSSYWTATGTAIEINEDGNILPSPESANNIRCVYDSWYWDNSDYPKIEGFENQQTFTWGDAEVF